MEINELTGSQSISVRFDSLTFNEWYGTKAQFQPEKDGMNYVCEVPAQFLRQAVSDWMPQVTIAIF